MTLFEYLAIAYSLVISFAVVRAASVLPHVLSRERIYWIHTFWVLANLVTCLVIFWNFWSFREVAWTLGRFSLVLALPTSVCSSSRRSFPQTNRRELTHRASISTQSA